MTASNLIAATAADPTRRFRATVESDSAPACASSLASQLPALVSAGAGDFCGVGK